MSGKRMTNRELVDAAIKLAGDFYSMMGYTHRPSPRLQILGVSSPARATGISNGLPCF